MSKTWFISDTHFRHSNILTFEDDDGNLIRPGFRDVDHMNEYMIERWNSVVKSDDKVYHLGDVLMGTSIEAFKILDGLNGRKVLIKGNHDTAKIHRYTEYFTDVRSEIHKKTPDGHKIVFTHRPIRLYGMDSHTFNVHGHIHQNQIDDYRYINMSVEAIDYTPVSWEQICTILEKRVQIMGDLEYNINIEEK